MPYVDAKPGKAKSAVTDEQKIAIRRIIARHMACEKLPSISPFTGVLPTFFPPGFNDQDTFEVRLQAFDQPDRIANGQERSQAIANEVAEVVGYDTTVWLDLEGTFFYAENVTAEATAA